MPDTTPAQPTTAALRALAEAATPGPWLECSWDPMERPHVSTMSPGHHGKDDIAQNLAAHNAAYIAAVDPQTVLALLDENAALLADNDEGHKRLRAANARAERAEAVVAAARMVLAVWPNIVNHPRLHNSEIDALAAALDALSGAERP